MIDQEMEQTHKADQPKAPFGRSWQNMGRGTEY